MTTPLSPAEKRYRRALRAYNQPHDLNSLIEARKALEAAERALEEERRKPIDDAMAHFDRIYPDLLKTVMSRMLTP